MRGSRLLLGHGARALPHNVAGHPGARPVRLESVDLRVSPRRDTHDRGEARRESGRVVRRDTKPLRLLADPPRLQHEPRARRGEQQSGWQATRAGLLRRPPAAAVTLEHRLREQADSRGV